MGVTTRFFQNYAFHRNAPEKTNWLPGGSAFLGFMTAYNTPAGANMYVADITAALAGDYLGIMLVDKVMGKK